jgi:hydrogenase nickel incorporation protein HypA/HybF
VNVALCEVVALVEEMIHSHMHEFGIANSILDTVSKEIQRRPGNRLVKVGVRIGDLSGIDAEALTFCFDALVSDTDLAPVALEIERSAHRRRCAPCGTEFEVDVLAFDASCPFCGNAKTDFVTGDELEIAYLEVEEE